MTLVAKFARILQFLSANGLPISKPLRITADRRSFSFMYHYQDNGDLEKLLTDMKFDKETSKDLVEYVSPVVGGCGAIHVSITINIVSLQMVG